MILRARVFLALMCVGGFLLPVGGSAGRAEAAKSATPKPTTTKKAKPTAPPTTRKPIPRLAGAEATAFCDAATDAKGVLADIRAKKAKLGAKAPASLYEQEIAVDATLGKKSPKVLQPDFTTVTSYLALFVKLSGTKDSKQLAKIAAEMGSDETLAAYLDATIRIEGFVRRTCGFPVGI